MGRLGKRFDKKVDRWRDIATGRFSSIKTPAQSSQSARLEGQAQSAPIIPKPAWANVKRPQVEIKPLLSEPEAPPSGEGKRGFIFGLTKNDSDIKALYSADESELNYYPGRIKTLKGMAGLIKRQGKYIQKTGFISNQKTVSPKKHIHHVRAFYLVSDPDGGYTVRGVVWRRKEKSKSIKDWSEYLQGRGWDVYRDKILGNLNVMGVPLEPVKLLGFHQWK